jgi:hypothetical protein
MPASWTIYGLRGIWFENDASQISIHPRMGGVSGTRYGDNVRAESTHVGGIGISSAGVVRLRRPRSPIQTIA